MKKLNTKVIISFILSMFMTMMPIFTGANLVKGETVNNVTCNVRVEGLTGTIAEGKDSGKDLYDILEKVLGSKKIPCTISQSKYGKYISSINGIAAGKFGGYDGWMYYMKNDKSIISPNDAYGYNLKNGDNIIVYYGASSTSIVNSMGFSPSVVKENKDFKIKFSYKHYDWNTKKLEETLIKNCSVIIDSLRYTTDNNGEIKVKGLSKGEHSYKISGYNKNTAPTVVMDKGTFTINNVNSPSINFSDTKYEEVNNKNIIKNIQNNIDKTSSFVAKNINDEWSAVSLNKLNMNIGEKFISNSVNKINKNGIENISNTELEKLIVGLTASGYTPYDFMKKDLVAELFNRDIKTFYINDAVFGMIVYNYTNNKKTYKITRENLKDIILKNKLSYKSNGNDIVGWTYWGKKIDPDMTGITIAALSTFYNSNSNVKGAIDASVKSLSNIQDESGCLVGNYGISSESISFAILGLTSVGINPEGKEFTKSKGDLVAALLSFATNDGTFKHELKDTKGSNMSTEQALRALIAIKEFKIAGSGIYNYYGNSINMNNLKVYQYDIGKADTKDESKTDIKVDTKDKSKTDIKVDTKDKSKMDTKTQGVETKVESKGKKNNKVVNINKSLPQTGFAVDDTTLIVLGMILVVIGATLVVKKRKNIA